MRHQLWEVDKGGDCVDDGEGWVATVEGDVVRGRGDWQAARYGRETTYGEVRAAFTSWKWGNAHADSS